MSLAAGIGSLLFSLGSHRAWAHSMGQVDLSYQRFRAELKRLGFDRYRPYAKDIFRYELEWLPEQEWLAALDDETEPPGFPFYHASGRLHQADAEDLAEGGIAKQLSRLRGLLRLLGVPEFRVSQEVEPDYVVTIDGVPYTVWTRAEVRDPFLDHWGVATAATLQILNDLLETAGSQERAYSYAGGHDLHIVFLTPDMFDLYHGVSSIPERDKPQAMRPHGIRYDDQ